MEPTDLKPETELLLDALRHAGVLDDEQYAAALKLLRQTVAAQATAMIG